MSDRVHLNRSELVAVFHGLIRPMLGQQGFSVSYHADEPHKVEINKLGAGYSAHRVGSVVIGNPSILYSPVRENKQLDEILSQIPFVRRAKRYQF